MRLWSFWETLCPNDPYAFFRDAEKILREKELGCFLIRLSNKSIGYILSYKWVGWTQVRWVCPSGGCISMDLTWKMISDYKNASTSCVSLLQRQRSVSTLCDQPKQIRAVFVLWRQQSSRHGAWSHRILQDDRHSAIWRTAYDLVFWGKIKIKEKSFSFYWATLVKKEGSTGVLLWQALSEELYDIIQVGPEEKPASAVRNLVLEQPPSRPPRTNRTLTVGVT